ncbi:serine/threonine-protein kinase BLUS1-like [Solanum dulcamara]|uniref:serine/threonine-protein kinase BLUS1-like n=1 Tax=Solanum dulcamara TaxID=45834 RepID=UPI0024866370|nr:serine/threonine-protein kinase BLUS1-like [Solanum dulcamara]
MDTLGDGGGSAVVAYRPATGTGFVDLNTATNYILQKVIGTCDFNFIYKACYFTFESILNDSILPTGYATVKYIRPGHEVLQSTYAKQSIPNSNIIHVKDWPIHQFREGFCFAMPYMSEGSLRYILSTRFHYGLPEDCIAIALKQALLGLSDLHNSGRVHKCFSAGNIYVNFKPNPVPNVEIKLGFAATIYESDLETPFVIEHGVKPGDQIKPPGGPSTPELCTLAEWAAAPEIFYAKDYYDSDDANLNPAQPSLLQDDFDYTIKSDIWLVGIAALELAYGNLRISNRGEFEALIKKIKRSKILPDKLEYLLEEIRVEEGKGKMKKVVGYFKDKLKLVKNKREKKFSKDFEKLVLDCLSSKPSKRPSVQNLLHRPFFRYAKDLKWFKRRVLHAKNPMPYC